MALSMRTSRVASRTAFKAAQPSRRVLVAPVRASAVSEIVSRSSAVLGPALVALPVAAPSDPDGHTSHSQWCRAAVQSTNEGRSSGQQGLAVQPQGQ